MTADFRERPGLPAGISTTSGGDSQMQNENFSAPEETPGGYNFGTFAGVYTPALLTILGLVMFMRTNFVLGNAGLFQ